MVRQWIGILLAGLLWVASVHAEPTIQVIDMKGALPEQVLPLVQPLLKPGESVQPFRNQLVFFASQDTLVRVQALLKEVDRPPQNLLIQVSDRIRQTSASSDMQVQGSASVGRARVQVNEDPRFAGRDHLSVGLREQQGSRTDDSSQQVRAVEGFPAFIATGQQAPVAVSDGYGRSAVAVQSANQGFFVTARLQGGQVFLDISTSHDQLESARMDTRRVVSTVSGRLGEWIAVGGTDQQTASSAYGFPGNGSSQVSSSGTVYIKVDLAN